MLGFLGPDGGVDLDAVERVVAELDGCAWTFHRAIDRAADRDALRKQLADLPGLDAYLTAGAADGVDDGLATLLREAALHGEPGYEQRLLVGGGLRLDHVPPLIAAGVDAFHIGGAARPEGWERPCRRRPWASGGRSSTEPEAPGPVREPPFSLRRVGREAAPCA